MSDSPAPQAPSSTAARESGSGTEGGERPLGMISLSCLVVANMIGAGVYTSSGFALADLGSPVLVLAAWLVAGAVALLGSMCYGGLAQQMSQSGGEYLFLSRGVHPLAGFMAGWVSLTAGFSGAIAFAAITFREYLPQGPWSDGLPPTAIPLALIALFGLFHWLGIPTGSRVQNTLVIVKLGVLVGFVLYGISVLAVDGAAAEAGEAAAERTGPGSGFSLAAFATSVMWISFSYAGYNASVYVAGAARGGAVVARSMWVATLVVAAIYVALNGVVLFSTDPALLAGQKDVLKIAAGALGGAWLQGIVTGVILLSLATSVSAMIQAGPHVYAQMARDGLLPRVLACGEQHVPRWGIALQVVLAGVVVVFADLQQLLDYLAFLLSISSAATVGCLLLPRFAGDSGNRPVSLWPITPLIFILVSLLIAALAFWYRIQQNAWGLVYALAVLPTGLLIYPIVRRRASPSRGASSMAPRGDGPRS